MAAMRKRSADPAEFKALPVTQSADLPVRPFGTEPAEPAFAAGASPEAPGAAPARALPALCALLLLFTAGPALAGRCGGVSKLPPQVCRVKAGQAAPAAPAKKAHGSTIVVLKGGNASTSHWMPIASDLMP